MTRRNARVRIFSVLLLMTAAALALAQADKPIEKFTAFAASLGTGKTGAVEITVNRWSTDEERDRLLTTLQEFGPDRLLDELQKIRPPVGRIRRPGSIGWDLYYARNHPNPDGSRRVILATNRPVAFREAASNTRSMQYQFTLIELRLDTSGKGEGKLVPAAKVTWDRDAKRLEIENYSALPVELLSVKAEKP